MRSALTLPSLALSRLPYRIFYPGLGAIAHGHPIGATGAILTTKLIHSIRRDGLKRGLVTLCIGSGQDIALAIETAHQIVIRLNRIAV